MKPEGVHEQENVLLWEKPVLEEKNPREQKEKHSTTSSHK